MTDRVLIRDLLVRGIVGINPEERENRQDVLVNVVMHVDTRRAAASDAIEDAVNYRTVSKRIIHLVETAESFLVEKLAAEVAAICLEDERVERADVTVEKPTALRFARSVGVTISRTREDL